MDSERLTRRFDAFERRMRGMRARKRRSPLEPKYRPFLANERQNRGIVDDGRSPGLLERWFGRSKPPKQATAKKPRAVSKPKRVSHLSTGELVELELMLGPESQVDDHAVRAFLASLSGLSHQAGFELVATEDRVVSQFVCDAHDRVLVRGALRSQFPDVRVRERRHALADAWLSRSGYVTAIGLGLAGRAFYRLRADAKLVFDPLAGVVGSMDDLEPGECAALQVLFAPVRSAWARDLDEFVAGVEGTVRRRDVEDDRRILPFVREKFAEQTFATVIRIAAMGKTAAQASDVAFRIANAVDAATRSEDNRLTLTPRSALPYDLLQADILDRQTRRHGMFLSLSELATVVHPPAPSVRSPKLLRTTARTKGAPPSVLGKGLLLGVNEHEDIAREVRLPPAIRARHTWILGSTGTGKSTLLLNTAIQDIEAGNGFALIDPAGDLVEAILDRIPPERARDVIVVDPSDSAYPIAFNVLAPHSEVERTLLASDFVSVFRRLSSTTFGDQMVSVLSNAVLAILESKQGGTLLDLRRFLRDASFRTRFLATVEDDEVRSFWGEEAKLLKGNPAASILTRLNTFLRPKSIRYMIAQKENRLDMRAIMDERKILLCKLSHGLMGEENAHLLGSLIVSELSQAAMSRQDEELAVRTPFTIVLDDAHHFITPSLANVLSSTRKYGVSLCLASHELRQAKARSEEVASALFAHAATRIVFHLGDQDARAMADGFSYFEAADVQDLGVGEAIVRVERRNADFNLRTILREAVDAKVGRARREAVIAASREQYATPRRIAEDMLSATRDERRSADEQTKTDVRGARGAGRGGTQHKYLQSLVRKVGEERGYAVSLEREILDGHGYVDAILEKGDTKIACEIAVTTRASHEVGNLTKCLSGDFSYVVLISSRPSILKAARLDMDADARLRFLDPERFIAFLDELEESPLATPNAKTERAATIAGKRPRLDSHAAAKYVGLARQTLAKLRTIGGGPKFEKLGTRVVYDPDDLDAWLALRKRSSTSDDGKRSGLS